jgi:hypothetical protein
MRRLLQLGRALALTAGILVLTFGGIALASSQGTSSQGTISACVHARGGGLYVGRCARGEKQLSWAQRGPQGPPGPAGPGAVAINNDGIPNGTTQQLWTSGTETLSIQCQVPVLSSSLTGFVINSTEPASVNGFWVIGALAGGGGEVRTFGAAVDPSTPASVNLGLYTGFRYEGQLEIARFGLAAAVWTLSFHVHVDNSGNCHIQATIFPARS